MWLTLVSLSFAAPDPVTSPRPPCGTPARFVAAPKVARRLPAPPPAGGERVMRDPLALVNHRTTEHFAIHFGELAPAEHVLDDLAAAFETAWAVQIAEMGHTPPEGTDSWLFNVYIGNSGEGAPDAVGVGGYYTRDAEGLPMVVVAWDMLFEHDYLQIVAYHEFFHAIQGATERYPYDDPGAWLWEATAEWAAVETDPENPAGGSNAGSYLLLPALPVNYFDYPDTGILEEGHQYGAFLFAHDLTRQVGSELIRDVWNDPGTEPDPLEVMRAWLAERGHDFDDLWLDHIAHNAVYDYDRGDDYEETVDLYTTWWYPELERSIEVEADGGSGRVARATAPKRYGATLIRSTWPIDGTLEIAITGDAKGTEGSPARYGARVVQEWSDGTFTYTDVPFDGVTGALTLDGVGNEDALWLVVGAWTETWDGGIWHDESFPFDWSMTISPPPELPELPDPIEEEEGPTTGFQCNCDSAGGGAGGWVLGLAALAGLMRRRR